MRFNGDTLDHAAVADLDRQGRPDDPRELLGGVRSARAARPSLGGYEIVGAVRELPAGDATTVRLKIRRPFANELLSCGAPAGSGSR